MKPVDVKNNTYIDSSKKVNDRDPKCKIFLLKDLFQTCLKKSL